MSTFLWHCLSQALSDARVNETVGEYLRREFNPEQGARKVHSIFPEPCRAKYVALGLISLVHNGDAKWDDVESYFMDCFNDQRVSFETFITSSCSTFPVHAVLEEYAKSGGATPMKPNNPVENWEGMLDRLQDCVGLSLDLNTWISKSTAHVPGCGILLGNRSSIRTWLSTLRNQYTDRLKLLGSVLQQQQGETWQVLNIIAESGCNRYFGLSL